ncbi:hypothetical protein FFWV33_19075 [Flavobacterium faecale]|uniref:Uncharacterized protein n=1 Tax=Flavobacterium faecale TaxID=1355330 RepID=A0A2S1LI96_9FLAO|nr:hypothetical protein FFWV33_19075 [Flavobacterium faecale]
MTTNRCEINANIFQLLYMYVTIWAYPAALEGSGLQAGLFAISFLGQKKPQKRMPLRSLTHAYGRKMRESENSITFLKNPITTTKHCLLIFVKQN